MLGGILKQNTRNEHGKKVIFAKNSAATASVEELQH
jgi:hypothetical protein